MNDLENILNRIKIYFNVKKDKEVADLLGVKQQTLTNWKIRNKIPYKEITSLCLEKGIILSDLLKDEIKDFEEITKFANNYEEEIKEDKQDKLDEITRELSKLDSQEMNYFYHFILAEINKHKAKNKNNKLVNNQLEMIIAKTIFGK